MIPHVPWGSKGYCSPFSSSQAEGQVLWHDPVPRTGSDMISILWLAAFQHFT